MYKYRWICNAIVRVAKYAVAGYQKIILVIVCSFYCALKQEAKYALPLETL